MNRPSQKLISVVPPVLGNVPRALFFPIKAAVSGSIFSPAAGLHLDQY